MWRGLAIVLSGLMVLGGCGEGEPGSPYPTLDGEWELTGYSDHGVAAMARGTATFGIDGTFALMGEVTFPGEPTEALNVSGTWSMKGDRVTLTTADESGDWVATFAGTEATLTRVGPEPTNVIELRRPQEYGLDTRPTSPSQSGPAVSVD